MTYIILSLVISLSVILISSEMFTNALEHFGQYLKISEGVTGSLFAAVGTALPETCVPLLALLAGTSNHHLNEEIGVGAILGAPLMLSTLSLFLMGLSVVKKRGIGGRVTPENSGLKRDLNFFLFAFGVAAVAMYVPLHWSYLRAFCSIILVLSYFVYILLTIRASQHLVQEGHSTKAESNLYITKLGLPNSLLTILVQIIAALCLLIVGAKFFIAEVESVAKLLSISPLLLSLLIIPIATELPEKINSILWIRRGKDTLAFGNITGAMVFQGTLLPAIGIMLTPWQPHAVVLMGVCITLIAALLLRVSCHARGIPIPVFFVNGVLYVSFLMMSLS